MKNKQGRRSFLKSIGLGTVATGLVPNGMVSAKDVANKKQSQLRPSSGHKYNEAYTGEHLNRVAFPIGGLGAGMFCMEGTGAISHMSIKNQPDIFNEPGLFAAIAVKGITNGAKVLEGEVPDWKKFGYPDAGNGGMGGSTTGLPRFKNASFLARFPFGILDIDDNDLPLKVNIVGWSPFIPGDENNSGLPVGAMEYTFKHTGTKAMDAVFSFNTKNFIRINDGNNSIKPFTNGFILQEAGKADKPLPTSFAIFTDQQNTTVDHCWFRGGWWDPFTMAWNAVKNAEIKSVDPVEKDAPGASLYVPFSLQPGESKTIKIFFAWYTPNSEMTYGEAGKPKVNCNPASGCCNSPSDIGLDKYDKDFNGKYYKPWYSNRFASVEEAGDYWLKNYDELKSKSSLFRDAFYNSTLPPEVIEAVAANLTILKSPTVLRQYDGRLWAFEGCADTGGCCHGSCTHVWNYAQAICHLFPALERSLRATEFCENQDVNGHQTFRAVLPIEPNTHTFYSAADGQLGGIMKVYREWRISGDDVWLQKIFPMVKTSMDYCIETWDPRHRGAIEEPHHNTYDIEFWGADGMHGTFYLGALEAFIAMGSQLKKEVRFYKDLHDKCRNVLETELYNGEYFIQHIQYTGLRAQNPATAQSFGGDYSPEAKALLKEEGPKYQYGTGCLSDGVLGSWMARMCMLNDNADRDKIKSHLKSVHQYNLKQNLEEHANPQRPSFALGDDGGLLLCTWPKGGQLSLPFVYSDEVWTGIEHQSASHMMMMGMVDEGLEVLRLSRNRYDGRVRNPFNEYECGHWYARAMSSYGYLQALTGVRYDAVDKILYVDSKVGDFTSFLSTETGFGNVVYSKSKATLNVVYGNIDVKKTIVNT
ncbi:MAG TPA: GH116 family glycosyl hydrolase [Chitinophagaceae bacterium]|nr:GH116 family glycosyl hydrolase [Chitinophagaceae bacterium]